MTSLIAGVLIFFVPGIVNMVFGFVTDTLDKETENADIRICRVCIFDPLSDECERYGKLN